MATTRSTSSYFRDKARKGYLLIEELQDASPEAFKAANRKGDRRLTLQEYVNALFIDFDKADTDKDGSLTFEEIEVYSRTTGRWYFVVVMGQGPIGLMFTMLVARTGARVSATDTIAERDGHDSSAVRSADNFGVEA